MRNVFDLSHVKSVTAWALVDEKGESLGRVVANWSDNPNGSVCTCAVHLWDDVPARLGLTEDSDVLPQGSAGGYGYDKLSAAFIQALRRRYGATYEQTKHLEGGESCIKNWFKSHGINVISVIG